MHAGCTFREQQTCTYLESVLPKQTSCANHRYQAGKQLYQSPSISPAHPNIRLNLYWMHSSGCTGTNASKWDLLFQMEVFTLDASNIKGIARKFACSHLVWIRPSRFLTQLTFSLSGDLVQKLERSVVDLLCL